MTNKKTPQANPWSDEQQVASQEFDKAYDDFVKPTKQDNPPTLTHADFDLEGLMTDFPTAKDLERFVYDQTGIVLNLKGRANKLKYQIAMDALNGVKVDDKYLGGENPYLEKAELVPVDPIKPVPERDRTLPPHSQQQNAYVSRMIPHPDETLRMQNKKVDTVFRKYKNGQISYEIMGPVDQKPEGEKLDKFGRMRPEVIRWIDPRSGEQTVVRKDGTLTPLGRNLRALMQGMKVNKSNQWDIWVDREFGQLESGIARNVWNIGDNDE